VYFVVQIIKEIADMNEKDLEFLRRSFAVALRSRERGNHPFGALLVDTDGSVLLEAENTLVSERDCTGHAEINLVREISRRFDTAQLARSTLYSSTEPCAMCSGAIYWSGVGRLVYGLSSKRLSEIIKDNPTNPPLMLSCREVFAHGQQPIIIEGPAIESEAELVHEGFW
jgi:tRNA(Arg) A34 adenosine deaminase TadA